MKLATWSLATVLVLILSALHAAFAAEPSAEAVVREARALFQADKKDEGAKVLADAIARFEARVAEQPDDDQAAFELSQVQYELRGYQVAVKSLDKAIALKPKEPAYRLFKAVMLWHTRQFDATDAEYQQVIELAPKEPKYVHEYGLYLLSNRRAGQAVTQFRPRLAIDPLHVPSIRLLAAQLMEQGKTDEAITLVAGAVEKKEKDIELRQTLGQIYQNAGRHQDAYKQFSAWTAVDPSSIFAEAKLVQLSLALEKKDDAEKHLANVYKLYKDGKALQPFFSREQFQVGDTKVIVLEYFELQGPQALKYSFEVLDATGKKAQYRVTLGSYDFTTQIAREAGQIKPDERVYHLDYYRGNEHRTYGLFDVTPPTYDKTRAMVVDIVKGKGKPVTSSVLPKDK